MYFVNALIIIWLSQGGNLQIFFLDIDLGNRVVVYEKAYNIEHSGQVLHTVPLGSNCVRVRIHDPLDDNAPLPIPHRDNDNCQ